MDNNSLSVLEGREGRASTSTREEGRGEQVAGRIKYSPLWSLFTILSLNTNMRVTSGDTNWAEFVFTVI